MIPAVSVLQKEFRVSELQNKFRLGLGMSSETRNLSWCSNTKNWSIGVPYVRTLVLVPTVGTALSKTCLDAGTVLQEYEFRVMELEPQRKILMVMGNVKNTYIHPLPFKYDKWTNTITVLYVMRTEKSFALL